MNSARTADPTQEASPLFRAGVFYLASILIGGAAAYVRWRLVIPADPTATATNILAHEPLFRMLLAADLISAACYVAVTLVLHEMFKPVNRRLSLLTVFFSFISSAIVAFACLFHIAALVILRGAQYLKLLAVQPLADLALICLRLRAEAYSISLMFFAFNCLLIGYLIYKYGFVTMRRSGVAAMSMEPTGLLRH